MGEYARVDGGHIRMVTVVGSGDGRVLLRDRDEGDDPGWDVEVVEAYRTRPATVDPSLLAAARKADAITFTSSSTVANYLALTGPDSVPPVVACIGPVTTATARHHGVSVDAVAAERTIAGLVDALCAALGHPHGR